MAAKKKSKKANSKAKPKQKRKKPDQPKKVTWKLHNAEEALQKLLNAVHPIKESEQVEISRLNNRILANSIKAPFSSPLADTSERDGYALRSRDCKTPGVILDVVGEATAGKPMKGSIGKGECVRIATGALIPDGADAVVMFEDVEAADGGIRIGFPPAKWDWISRAGSDLKQGRVVFDARESVSPPQIAALGAMGFRSAEVLKRPRALVFTTGNEVKKAGTELKPGQVYDGNTASIVALLNEHGVDAKARATVRDTMDGMCSALKKAASEYDLVVFTGGTSVGDKDFGRRALDELGRTIVHGVAVKPGKPLLFGKIGDCAVVGLPGYPTSALMIAYAFLVPVALKLVGYIEPSVDSAYAEVARPIHALPDKTLFLPVSQDEEGRIAPTFRGSASISSVARATGYIQLEPGDDPLEEGDPAIVRLM